MYIDTLKEILGPQTINSISCIHQAFPDGVPPVISLSLSLSLSLHIYIYMLTCGPRCNNSDATQTRMDTPGVT